MTRSAWGKLELLYSWSTIAHIAEFGRVYYGPKQEGNCSQI